MRDFEHWMHKKTREKVEEMIQAQHAALQKTVVFGKVVARPPQVGLCVLVYAARTTKTAGVPDKR